MTAENKFKTSPLPYTKIWKTFTTLLYVGKLRSIGDLSSYELYNYKSEITLKKDKLNACN